MKIEDPELYRTLCEEPYETVEKAESAMQAFFTDLRKLREAHRIPDLTAIALVRVRMADQSETQQVVVIHNGDSTKKLHMLAHAYGEALDELKEIAEPHSKKRR